MANVEKFEVDPDALQRLIDEASQIFEATTKSELKKSDDDKKGSEGSPEGEPPGEETPGEGSEGAPPAPADDAGGAAPADAPPVDAAGSDPAAGAVAAADPAAGQVAQPLDPQALAEGYAQMPPDELMAHLQAALQAAQQSGLMGGGAGGPPPPDAGMAPPPPAPPPAPAGAASASASPMGPPPPFGKGEMGSGNRVPASKGNEKANGGTEADAAVVKEGESFGKSEKYAELEKKLAEMAERNAILEKSVEVLLVPAQKAITGLDMAYLKKSIEDTSATQALPASRAEAMDRLREIARGDLTKSERDLINKFVFGEVAIEKLEGLFNKK